MRTVTKAFSVTPGSAAVKFRDGGDDLAFTAIVSRFGNKDSQGEIVDKGAFARSLEARSEVPCVWAHEWSDPFNYIGVAKCRETEEGLFVEAQLDGANPTARQVHRLMQLGVIKEFSFSASVEDGYIDDDGVPHLTSLDLFEVGPCLVGANRETSLETVSASGEADTEKGADVVEETTTEKTADVAEATPEAPATETGAETTAGAAPETGETEEAAPATPGLADLAAAILTAVQAQAAAAEAAATEPAPAETSEPVPSDGAESEEQPSEPVTEEDGAADLAQSLLDGIAEGLDRGDSAVTLLQGVVETLDSRVSGGKED